MSCVLVLIAFDQRTTAIIMEGKRPSRWVTYQPEVKVGRRYLGKVGKLGNAREIRSSHSQLLSSRGSGQGSVDSSFGL